MEPVRTDVRERDQKEAVSVDTGPAAIEVARRRSFRRINSETYYLWRAVYHEGEVLEVFVAKKRDRKAALRFLRKAMKRYGCPQVIVTDRLRSYRAAMREIGNEARQETGRWLNNRAENSHQPFRRRERAMTKFRSAKSLQKFAAVHASVHNLSLPNIRPH